MVSLGSQSIGLCHSLADSPAFHVFDCFRFCRWPRILPHVFETLSAGQIGVHVPPQGKVEILASVSMLPFAPHDERLQLKAPVVRLIAQVPLSFMLPQYGAKLEFQFVAVALCSDANEVGKPLSVFWLKLIYVHLVYQSSSSSSAQAARKSEMISSSSGGGASFFLMSSLMPSLMYCLFPCDFLLFSL